MLCGSALVVVVVLGWQWEILAVLALAVFATLEPSLVALTVLLEAIGLLAVAAFDMLLLLDFACKWIRVTIHEGKDGIVAFLIVGFEVVAA